MTESQLLDRLIRREGVAYTNRKSDRGGPTKFGITLQTLSQARGHQCAIGDLMVLSEGEAREIYQRRYLTPIRALATSPIYELVFDCAVLHGVGRAIRWLQRALDVEADGVIGPVTLGALGTRDQTRLSIDLTKQRLHFIGETVEKDHDQADYVKGWIDRAISFL